MSNTNISVGPFNLADGSIATTQAQSDNSTKLATTAYVDLAVAGAGGVSWGDAIQGTSGNGFEVNEYGVATQATAATYGIRMGANYNTNTAHANFNIYITNQNNAGAGYNQGVRIENYETDINGKGIYIIQYGSGGNAFEIYGSDNVNAGTYGLQRIRIGNTQSGATQALHIDLGTANQAHTGLYMKGSSSSSSASGIDLDMQTGWAGKMINASVNSVDVFTVNYTGHTTITNSLVSGGNTLNVNTIASGTLTSMLTNGSDYTVTRNHTGATTVSDDFHAVEISRNNIVNNASGTLNADGCILHLNNVATQTSGTLNDAVNILELSQDTDSTGAHILFLGDVTISSPTEGFMWRASDGLYYYDGTTSHNLLSGGGGASAYDATVGSAGADYTDIQSAITGVGGTSISLLMITSITEDSNITIGSGVKFLLNVQNFVLTMGAYQFLLNSGVGMYAKIVGNGKDSGAEIDWTHTVAGQQLFETAAGQPGIILDGLLLDNNSTANQTYISNAIETITNCRIECANVTEGGIKMNDGAHDSYYSNLEIVGGGATCIKAISGIASQAQWNNILITGTFEGSATDVAIEFSDCQVTNITFDHDTEAIKMSLRGTQVQNIKTISQDLDIDFDSTNCIIDSAELLGGDIDFKNKTDCRISKVNTTGLFDFTDSNCANNMISDSYTATACAVAGDRIKFSNVDFVGGASVSSGGSNNIFGTGCQFGPDAGGSALTLTFDSGSVGNTAVGCIADADMVDNGTGNTQVWTTY